MKNVKRSFILLILVFLLVYGYYQYITPSPSGFPFNSEVPSGYYDPEEDSDGVLQKDDNSSQLAYIPNSRSGMLLVVDIEQGDLLGTIKLGEFGEGPFNILFSPDKTKFLCTFPRQDVVKVYDSETFTKIKEVKVGKFPTYIIGKYNFAYVFSEDSGVYTLDLTTITVVGVAELEEGPEDGVVTNDGVAYFTTDDGVYRLAHKTFELEKVLNFESEESQIAVSNDGSTLFYAYCLDYESEYNLRMYDTRTWSILHETLNITTHPAPDGSIRCLVVTKDDLVLFTDDYSGILSVFDPVERRVIRHFYTEMDGRDWAPRELFLSPDDEYACILSWGGVAIEGGMKDNPSQLMVLDSNLEKLHEIQLDEYAGVSFLAFR